MREVIGKEEKTEEQGKLVDRELIADGFDIRGELQKKSAGRETRRGCRTSRL